MEMRYAEELTDAKVEAKKVQIGDILPHAIEYFHCGYEPKKNAEGCYYNYSIALAFAVIGKIYGTSQKGASNYHKGIVYIANELEKEGKKVSKRQIKSLRKKFSKGAGYVFETPYKIDIIVKKIIELLAKKESEPIVIEFLKRKNGKIYRELLISKQYSAIMAAAKEEDERIREVYGRLQSVTTKVKI